MCVGVARRRGSERPGPQDISYPPPPNMGWPRALPPDRPISDAMPCSRTTGQPHSAGICPHVHRSEALANCVIWPTPGQSCEHVRKMQSAPRRLGRGLCGHVPATVVRHRPDFGHRGSSGRIRPHRGLSVSDRRWGDADWVWPDVGPVWGGFDRSSCQASDTRNRRHAQTRARRKCARRRGCEGAAGSSY